MDFSEALEAITLSLESNSPRAKVRPAAVVAAARRAVNKWSPKVGSLTSFVNLQDALVLVLMDETGNTIYTWRT